MVVSRISNGTADAAVVRVVVLIGILVVVIRLGNVLNGGDRVVSISILICTSTDHDSLSVED